MAGMGVGTISQSPDLGNQIKSKATEVALHPWSKPVGRLSFSKVT
jgi:hypothetical protein